MDASIQLLLARARDHRAAKAEEEDVFVWWGKVRAPNRQQKIPHPGILAVDRDLSGVDGASR
jgi:hypothetical protein